MQYDVIIGFETHVELKTASKLFCSCAVTYGAPQNSQICPVCTGQPGALPVLNQRAVEYCHQSQSQGWQKDHSDMLPKNSFGELSREEIELELLKRKEAMGFAGRPPSALNGQPPSGH